MVIRNNIYYSILNIPKIIFQLSRYYNSKTILLITYIHDVAFTIILFFFCFFRILWIFKIIFAYVIYDLCFQF